MTITVRETDFIGIISASNVKPGDRFLLPVVAVHLRSGECVLMPAGEFDQSLHVKVTVRKNQTGSN